jgi:hypothetical protein
LVPTRKVLWEELCQALAEAGLEQHRVKEGKFDAFVATNEISLALGPKLAIRHGQLHLECTIAAFDRDFERSVGCEPFSLCSFQTFGAYYANFDEFYRHSWIRPERASDNLRVALAPYLDFLARYPCSRRSMCAELRSGTFGGLSLKYFVPTPKTEAFYSWLGVSTPPTLPN